MQNRKMPKTRIFLGNSKHTERHHTYVIYTFVYLLVYGCTVQCIYTKAQNFSSLTQQRLVHLYHTTRPIHTSVFQLLKYRVTFFHFLSMLFLDLCVCVQNNKLHDAVLVRGNAEPPGQSEEIMFSTRCGFFFFFCAIHYVESASI